MTTIDFPNDPQIDDEYTFGRRTWRWTGSAWQLIADGLPGPTGPAGPSDVLDATFTDEETGAHYPVFVADDGPETPLIDSALKFNPATDTLEVPVVSTPSVTNAGTLALSATGANVVTASTNGEERLRIDSAGNVGIGVTPSVWAGSALQVGAGGAVNGRSNVITQFSTNQRWTGSGHVYLTNGAASIYSQVDGNHNWATAPSGTAGDPITFASRLGITNAGVVHPGADNTQTLGASSFRWSEVFAGNGTINTSDAREKTDVRDLTEPEINAAKNLAREIGAYKFLSAIELKGEEARTHIGMTVQRAIEIMESHDLDPFEYGFICYNEWEEVTVDHPAVEEVEATEDSEAVEAQEAWTETTLEAGDRYGFRMDQLLAFIARGFEARLSALEAALSDQL